MTIIKIIIHFDKFFVSIIEILRIVMYNLK